jgi:FkbM family methyltransferase
MFNSLAGQLQNTISRSRLGVWCVRKVNNQCRAILGNAYGSTFRDIAKNGEATVIQHVKESIKLAVDVGANRGEWTQMVLQTTGAEACLLFEPSSSALSELRQRFADNSRVNIVGAAAGDSSGRLPFYEEPDAGELSTLVAGTTCTGEERTVQVTTLDSEIDRLGWPTVDYLKIDAEGYDFHVLRGARRLFERRCVALGQFEYGNAWIYAGSTLTYAMKWLGDLGYECFLLKNNRLYSPRPDMCGEYFAYSNYLFCHAGTRPLISSLVCASAW